MSEYVIMSFLRTPEVSLFPRSNWPMHVTMLGTFKTELTHEKMTTLLEDVCNGYGVITVFGKSKEMFGYNNEVSVTELKMTSELQELHTKILSSFSSQIELKAPIFSGLNYRPHVTDQLHENIKPGQEVVLDSISLVRLDAENVVVLSTVNL